MRMKVVWVKEGIYKNKKHSDLRLSESTLKISRRARLWVRKKSRLTAPAIFSASPRWNRLIKNLSSIQVPKKKPYPEQTNSTTRIGTLFWKIVYPLAKLAHFGLWEEIARDWAIVKCRGSCLNVVSRFSIINWSWKIFRIRRTLIIQKTQSHNFQKFHDFRPLELIAQDWEVVESWKECQNVEPSFFYLVSNLKKTVYAKFYDLSVSRNPVSKSKNRKICEMHGTDFHLI